MTFESYGQCTGITGFLCITLQPHVRGMFGLVERGNGEWGMGSNILGLCIIVWLLNDMF